MTARRVSCSILFLLLSDGRRLASAATGERTVDLTATDGTKLKGTYFSAGKAGPGVLLLHQCNRQRKVWDALAQQLSAAGLNVFTFDYRGFGESGGTPEGKLTPAEIGKQRGEVARRYRGGVSIPGVAARREQGCDRCGRSQLRRGQFGSDRDPPSRGEVAGAALGTDRPQWATVSAQLHERARILRGRR